MSLIKRRVAEFINQLGYEISRKPSFKVVKEVQDAFNEQKRICQVLAKDVKVVFDVGANIGQSAAKYRSLFSLATVYSFEPSKSCYNEIVTLAKKDSMIIPFNIALDCELGSSDFYDTGGQTASLLAPSYQVSYFYPETYFKVKRVINVPVNTIDNICTVHNVFNIDILKMDTQGTEDKVLIGAENMLKGAHIDLIYTEVSFTEIYNDQVIFYELCRLLSQYGYYLFNLYDFVRGSNGVIVGTDALFLRKELYELVIRTNIGDE